MPPSSRHLLLPLALIAATTAHAQQQPALTPQPVALSTWPLPGEIKLHTSVLITTLADPGTPYTCKLQSLDPDSLLCAGQHGARNVRFARETIGSIALPQHHPVRISTLLLGAGSGCLLIAYLVAINHQNTGGGSGNAALAESGLTMVIGGAIARPFDGHHEPGYQTPLYIAPRATFPASAPEPRN
jgi:hypothetical protein